MEYILLKDEFVKQWQGFKDGPNIFLAFKVERGEYKGQYVCNRSSRDEFPKLFKTEKLVVLNLDNSDFEVEYDKLDLVIDSKFPILMKIEDYVNKTVTIVYIENGEQRKLVKNIDQLASKTGYSVDIEKEIQEKPAEIKAEPTESKDENADIPIDPVKEKGK